MLLVYMLSSHPHLKHYRIINGTEINDLGTIMTILEDNKRVFFIIHVFLLIFFILESLAYLICYYLEIRRQKLLCSIKLILKPLIIFDLLTVTAFGLHLAAVVFFPILISMRVFRICWFMRHWSVGAALAYILQTRGRSLLLLLLTAGLGVLFFSTWVYHAEAGSKESHFKSLYDTLYFGFVSVTTVGYGDMRPISFLGKSIGVWLALFGVVFYALCAAVVIPTYFHYFRFAQYTRPSGGESRGIDGATTDVTKEVEDVDVPLVSKAE